MCEHVPLTCGIQRKWRTLRQLLWLETVQAGHDGGGNVARGPRPARHSGLVGKTASEAFASNTGHSSLGHGCIYYDYKTDYRGGTVGSNGTKFLQKLEKFSQNLDLK
jgi:hypothetical protein